MIPKFLHDAHAGLKAFKKKNEEDLSFFTSVQKGGKGNKGGKAGAAVQDKASAVPSAESKRKLQHSLETLKAFMSLGIDVPQNATEIAATILKVPTHAAHQISLGMHPAMLMLYCCHGSCIGFPCLHLKRFSSSVAAS
jgi:hypothetical protein